MSGEDQIAVPSVVICVAIIAVTLLAILTAGTPDLLDAIIQQVRKCS